jgi:hypothetical protein
MLTRYVVYFLQSLPMDHTIAQDQQAEVDKTKMVYGMEVGAAGDDDDAETGGTRVVQPGQRPFYTAEDIRSFRTLGMNPGEFCFALVNNMRLTSTRFETPRFQGPFGSPVRR